MLHTSFNIFNLFQNIGGKIEQNGEDEEEVIDADEDEEEADDDDDDDED